MFKSDDTGKLILRVALGILILLHGIAKVSKGVDGIGGMLASHGLPGVLAYLVYVGEIVAPVLLIIGLYTRPAAAIVAINMLVAIWLVHRKDLGALNGQGGWALELQGMFLFAAIALAFTGGGRFGLNNK
ncbi:GntR family transcriptional regulator [Variovorax paradoxus]|jgi:putative oxidoreductase|uniref:DoxX family protein n=1 Tax=Variovorax TaxID=34072 RepID=UPI0006E66C63|nr:DoxX family protein [Variovorax sp. CY25R-8]KPU88668.1 GntR family transcriptional regulator [Variovorax paradoxus]KPU92384.1 GntR family transcriptional regulator [Variovorax paradoxus]KPU93758.1 GntR family transcriptional regulator [Variovorax paradoxus]KPV14535.1 GntR family transcriptional regulator [Variovorax paradoxus]KPV20861.1 GntR family transcriptional regulator [Variovorax paradoxus]